MSDDRDGGLNRTHTQKLNLLFSVKELKRLQIDLVLKHITG